MTRVIETITTAKDLQNILKKLADPQRALHAQRFFKTGKGEYAEGDIFLGITVPTLRSLVAKCKNVPVEEIPGLLQSPLHEERLLALFLLVDRFKNGDEDIKKRMYDIYLRNTKHINNWDLVDCSAHLIVGAHLENSGTEILDSLAKSALLWERRIAVLAMFHFIRRCRFDGPLRLFGTLIDDKEDLIHKAVGWMLREIGKRDLPTEEAFLKLYYEKMPRTMLRYAIERFPEEKRVAYLKGSV